MAMFCPKCGKDCGRENFCAKCRQEIPLMEQITEDNIPEPPIGRYEGIDGYMDLSYYTLTVHKRILSQTVELVIPYRDIVDILFQQASNSTNGYLAVREEKDRLPLIETELDAICDEKAIVFSKQKNNVFCDVHAYLLDCLQKKESVQIQESIHRHGIILCPKCRSTRYHIRKRPRIRTYWHNMYRYTPPLFALLGCIVHLHYVLQKKRIEYTCLNCGYRWIK